MDSSPSSQGQVARIGRADLQGHKGNSRIWWGGAGGVAPQTGSLPAPAEPLPTLLSLLAQMWAKTKAPFFSPLGLGGRAKVFKESFMKKIKGSSDAADLSGSPGRRVGLGRGLGEPGPRPLRPCRALTAGFGALVRAIGAVRHAVAQLRRGHAVRAAGAGRVVRGAGPGAAALVAAVGAVLLAVAAPAPGSALAAAARELEGAAGRRCGGHPR